METMTIAEVISILESIEDKSQEVEVWIKSAADHKKIEFIYENAAGGLDIVVE